jgi:hypothetical protein
MPKRARDSFNTGIKWMQWDPPAAAIERLSRQRRCHQGANIASPWILYLGRLRAYHISGLGGSNRRALLLQWV